MKYLIANWKANKNLNECRDWLKVFIKESESLELNNTIIICPPYPLIYFTKESLKNKGKNIKLGAQDVSCFEKGKYTGEVTAATLAGLVDYCIIGHSERRQYFAENEEILKNKVDLAKKYTIEPIYCIRDVNDPIPNNVNLITYEPPHAIGTGNNEEVQDVLEVKKKLNIDSTKKFLYGGSATSDNALDYIKSSQIDGLLIGTMSLNVYDFLNIVKIS